MAPSFGLTIDQALAFCSPDALRLGVVRGYVAEVDGEPASTAAGVVTRAGTRVFNVATLPAFRKRGLGSAVTARAIADGVARGASGSWLQTSPEGYNVYYNLGFRTFETWQLWVSVE